MYYVCKRLTLDQQLRGARGPSAAVGGGHRICSRILWEGLCNQQTIQVSLLQDPEVCRALDLSSFSVKLHHRGRDSCDADVQSNLAALANCGTLKSLKKVRRCRLRCWAQKYIKLAFVSLRIFR